ncbi:MAG TPA: potassium-transporting ATPase subunit C [Streptosporangiaceae bacterium]|nr:potassium-transporting ATPase subunit C [Streptosporangiaceae bacterium]
MLATLRRAVLISAVFFVLLGLAYPLAETGIGQAFFAHQAGGSLTRNGSQLVGQSWNGARWFHGRPDADHPMATGGSNLGPRSKDLVKAAGDQIAALKKQGITPTPGLVTTSGSGVDPDISPADAYAQASAVAKARGLPVSAVLHLIASQIQQAQFGFLGSQYINVLQLNQALQSIGRSR